MIPCSCPELHARKRIVLTGGPGAGKTAVLELVRQSFCKHVDVLPEAASILFVGGFRRSGSIGSRQAVQRAVFHVQRELEAVADAEDTPAIVLCDRGTIDGLAYWPGGIDFWSAVGTRHADELERYSAVIHLRTPRADGGYHQNPVRIETAAEAEVIDKRIALAWQHHPRRFVVENSVDFMTKARQTIEILRGELPACCRR